MLFKSVVRPSKMVAETQGGAKGYWFSFLRRLWILFVFSSQLEGEEDRIVGCWYAVEPGLRAAGIEVILFLTIT